MTSIIPERQAALPTIDVTTGSHAWDPATTDTPEAGCVMEIVAWLRGEEWDDEPACVDKRLAALLRAVNDSGHVEDLPGWAREVAVLCPAGDASALLDRLAVRRLRESVLPLAPTWPEGIRGQVVAAIEAVIAAIEEDGDRVSAGSAAGSAARSAWSAWSAWSAAESAAWAAESAARSAESAAWAAASAARSAASAAWDAEAQRILEEIRALHDTTKEDR